MLMGGLAINLSHCRLNHDGGIATHRLWRRSRPGPIACDCCLFLIAGLFWGAVDFHPAVLQAYRGSHIVITTIMFSAIAGYFHLLKNSGVY